ncbi:protease HtpX [Salinibacter sp. 10B]|uniref:zinc metalloprotease HtpX n=1 Tax=Salinibacter sp. 10B TaxID=1923971 RepID=UPI000CF4C31F|nr:zinc metalloprotease HtpX [Salinibacter sp. 10B]PQJ35172.1 protease HtpX [Salinibacter sp. 10B]
MNTLRTTALMAVMFVLFALIGQALGGTGGMILAFLIAVGMNGVSYWFSSSIVLRMYGAEEVSRAEAPELHDMVDRLRQRADLPMPKVCIIPSDQPNAFATGRNPANAVVAVTEGIMNTLDRDELAGVIAHELAHIKNRDMLTSTVAATLAAAITLLARFGIFFDREQGFVTSLLMMILAPLAAMLIQMAISRSREYAADRDGAEIAGNPLGLANALRRMEQVAQQRPMRGANEATSHMFIVNPFSGGLSGMRKLFSTHPPTEERITRLEEMSRGA